MSVLTLHNVEPTDHLVSPAEFSDVELRSPALAVFTDFRRHEPFVIEGSTRAVDAAVLLRQCHNGIRLVVDRNDEFIGTISEADLSEARLLKRVATGEDRNEIRVVDMMMPRREVRALSYEDLKHATVRDLIETLQRQGEQHCLVINERTHNIRGFIAASDLRRRLHISLEEESTPTFARIFEAVRH